MKVKQGYMVKIADIGTPGVVVRVGGDGKAVVVRFNFPEGNVEGTLPVSAITRVLSTGKFGIVDSGRKF